MEDEGAYQSGEIRLLDKWQLALVIANDRSLGRADLACALHILDHYNRAKGYAWPSCSRLAELSGVSVRAVTESIKRLVAAGHFRVTGGKRAGYHYFPAFENAKSTSDKQGAKSEVDFVFNQKPTSDNGGDNRKPTSPYTSYSPVGTPEGEEEVSPPSAAAYAGASAARNGREIAARVGEPESFAAFWAACPKQERRAETLSVYCSLINSGAVSFGELVDGMRLYAKAKGHMEPRLIKFPDNWLKEERWKENPLPPKPKETSKAKEPAMPRTGSKPAEAPRPKRRQGPKSTKAGKRKAGEAAKPASGRGLRPVAEIRRPGTTPATVPAPTPRRAGFVRGDRVAHVRSGLTGEVVAESEVGRTAQVHWDGVDDELEWLAHHNLARTTVTAELGAAANRAVREQLRRRPVGLSLKNKREYRKLSIAELAEVVGVSDTVIAAIERGTHGEGSEAEFDQLAAKIEGAIKHY
ncbi:MAG TPA: helix-turn-helix domain-containing protein [Azospirillum sp.]|nr:helix-turn-helix domain-containing protein [Azospirillum sp.]